MLREVKAVNSAKRKMDRLEAALKAKKISRQTYLNRISRAADVLYEKLME